MLIRSSVELQNRESFQQYKHDYPVHQVSIHTIFFVERDQNSSKKHLYKNQVKSASRWPSITSCSYFTVDKSTCSTGTITRFFPISSCRSTRFTLQKSSRRNCMIQEERININLCNMIYIIQKQKTNHSTTIKSTKSKFDQSPFFSQATQDSKQKRKIY